MTADTFTGWAATYRDSPLKQMELPLREWDEDCVEIDVTHCGICGSDIHAILETWFPTDFPCVPGHEIVGVATRVGKNATKIKVGDRVGFGAQGGSCHHCDECLRSHENLCQVHRIDTYNATWDNGSKAYGGYADKYRGDYRFAFKIPDNLPSEVAATFFCAGITSYAPLKRNNVNEESVVGIMGIGGLGHYGVLFAKAMGAKVIGMSHSEAKREVALELGCDDFINTSNDEQMAKYKYKMTHILCTGAGSDFQWPKFLDLLRSNGQFINVNLPDWNLPELNALYLAVRQVYIHGSLVGAPHEIEEMLEFAAQKNIRPWIQLYKFDNIQQAIQDFKDNKPRFRFVLEK